MTYILRMIATLLLPLALIGCGSQSPPPPLAGAKIGGPFVLLDKAGREVRWSDFDGRYRIVYFGYTFCPDACPMDVQAMMAGFAAFEEAHPKRAARVQPIFISIDPARDTPETVGAFAAAFHPRLLGLTGSPEQVATAAKAFAVYYAKGEESAGGYLMDHSRAAYLMGPAGEPIALLPVDKGPLRQAAAAVTAELEKWVK
ncbi:MAG: SCO family protein [Novosphingobium sp.]|nr:SCO family protein [Novosphingobium sp.]